VITLPSRTSGDRITRGRTLRLTALLSLAAAISLSAPGCRRYHPPSRARLEERVSAFAEQIQRGDVRRAEDFFQPGATQDAKNRFRYRFVQLSPDTTYRDVSIFVGVVSVDTTRAGGPLASTLVMFWRESRPWYYEPPTRDVVVDWFYSDWKYEEARSDWYLVQLSPERVRRHPLPNPIRHPPTPEKDREAASKLFEALARRGMFPGEIDVDILSEANRLVVVRLRYRSLSSFFGLRKALSFTEALRLQERATTEATECVREVVPRADLLILEPAGVGVDLRSGETVAIGPPALRRKGIEWIKSKAE
jgi:Holliday junction resolvase-like predicted endonuclease